MTIPRIELPYHSDSPFHVSVLCAGAEESSHAVDVAMCDADGTVPLSLGDVERPVFRRSAMKPLQAIALAEAWDALDVDRRPTSAEFALIYGSHNGQPEHVDAMKGLLAKAGLDTAFLTCGSHWSSDQQTMVEKVQSFESPKLIHNNFSGKHAGMLALSKAIGAGQAGYADLAHPIQESILGIVEMMVSVDVMSHTHGIDGCGGPRTGRASRQLGARIRTVCGWRQTADKQQRRLRPHPQQHCFGASHDCRGQTVVHCTCGHIR